MTNDRNLATKLASPWSVRFTRCGLADTPLDSDSSRCVLQENTEKPKCKVDQDCLRIIEKLDPAERPLDILGHGAGSFSSYLCTISSMVLIVEQTLNAASSGR